MVTRVQAAGVSAFACALCKNSLATFYRLSQTTPTIRTTQSTHCLEPIRCFAILAVLPTSGYIELAGCVSRFDEAQQAAKLKPGKEPHSVKGTSFVFTSVHPGTRATAFALPRLKRHWRLVTAYHRYIPIAKSQWAYWLKLVH